MKEVEANLADDCFEKMKNATNDIDCEEGGMSSGKLWSLRKEICPQSRDPPTAMMDLEGNLVTNAEKIKEMVVSAYVEGHKKRHTKEGMEDLKDMKERLSERLMELAKTNKTPPWEMSDVDEVLKDLKKKKIQRSRWSCK